MRTEEKIFSWFLVVMFSILVLLVVLISRNTIEREKFLKENRFHITHTSGRSVEHYYTNSEIKYNEDCCEFTDSSNRKIKISGPYSVIEY
jgi:hypothetical protein